MGYTKEHLREAVAVGLLAVSMILGQDQSASAQSANTDRGPAVPDLVKVQQDLGNKIFDVASPDTRLVFGVLISGAIGISLWGSRKRREKN